MKVGRVKKLVKAKSNPREFFDTGGWQPVQPPGKEHGYIHGPMLNGGTMEVGFYHEKCHYANYKDGTVDIPAAPALGGGEHNSDTEVEEGFSLTCGRCDEDFSFGIMSSAMGGVWRRDLGMFATWSPLILW